MATEPLIINTSNVFKGKDNAIGLVIYPTVITFLIISIVLILNPSLMHHNTGPLLSFMPFWLVELIIPFAVLIIACILYKILDKKNNAKFNEYFPTFKKEIFNKYKIDITMDEAKQIMSKEEFIRIASVEKYVYFTLTEKSKHQMSLVVTMNTEIPVPYKHKA